MGMCAAVVARSTLHSWASCTNIKIWFCVETYTDPDHSLHLSSLKTANLAWQRGLNTLILPEVDLQQVFSAWSDMQNLVCFCKLFSDQLPFWSRDHCQPMSTRSDSVFRHGKMPLFLPYGKNKHVSWVWFLPFVLAVTGKNQVWEFLQLFCCSNLYSPGFFDTVVKHNLTC